MSQEQILKILTTWQAAMKECEKRMDMLADAVGPVVDSPLGDAVYGLMGAYTRAVSDQIGWPDDALSAWWCEHQFGERPMRMGFAGEPLRAIATIEDLAAFIAEDLASGAA